MATKAKKEEETLVYGVVHDSEGKIKAGKYFTVEEWENIQKIAPKVWKKGRKPKAETK